MAKKRGRRKGTRSKGYFFRAGRGWFTKANGRFVPLTDSSGERLREREIPIAIVREAYARQIIFVVPPQAHDSPSKDALVAEVCAAYLDQLRATAGAISSNPSGRAKTYIDRGQTLYDFCYGLPGEFFCRGDRELRKAKGDAEKRRIHLGFGTKRCSELTASDLDTWFKAHNWSLSGWRTRVQAVKRAMNFGVERRMIPSSPIRGFRVPRSTARVTYLTPEQEAAMIQASSPAFAAAIRVCIRTGARFGCEFAALTTSHIRDHGDRMEWVFKPEETKTHKLRIIRIKDPLVLDLVRQAARANPHGPIFRNQVGQPWTRSLLSQNFRRVKSKILKKGVRLDADACMYSCRHTYAKRVLDGFWTGKPSSLHNLARLMGNTVPVCINHYLQFSTADNEMLWDSA